MSNVKYETVYGLNFEQKEKLKLFFVDKIMKNDNETKNLKILHNINKEGLFKIILDTNDIKDVEKLKLFIKNDLQIELEEEKSLKQKLKEKIEKMQSNLKSTNLNDIKGKVALMTAGAIIGVAASYTVPNIEIDNKTLSNLNNKIHSIDGKGLLDVFLDKGYWEQLGVKPPQDIQDIMSQKYKIDKEIASEFKENLKFYIIDRGVDINEKFREIKEKIEIAKYVQEHSKDEIKDPYGNKVVFNNIPVIEPIKLGIDNSEKSLEKQHVDNMNKILDKATKIATVTYVDLAPKKDLTPKKSINSKLVGE